MATRWLRVRRLTDGRLPVIVALLALLLVVGAWGTYTTYVEPGTHVEQRQESAWSTTTDFDHEATVRESNPVYPVGTTLTNRTAYFGSVAPILNGTTTFEYAASESGNLTVIAETWLVFQRVERSRNGEIETVYWQTTRELEQHRSESLSPGESVDLPFAFNVSALNERSSQIDDELGRTNGETEALVRTSVTVNGTVNGQRVNRAEQHKLSVGVGEVYRVSDSGPATNEFTSTHSVTVENNYGPIRSIGAPLLLAGSVSVLGLIGFAWHRNEVALTPAEREYLSYQADRDEFDEWINRISSPNRATGPPSGEAETLADLVDFAIDTNSSVVEDPETGRFHVIHDGERFIYEPPPLPFREKPSPPDETNAEKTGNADDATDPLDPEPEETDD